MAPRQVAERGDHRLFCDGPPQQAQHGVLSDVHESLLRDTPPLNAVNGVRTLLFSSPRPFHPDRLHGAISSLLDGVRRARGRFWLATRPLPGGRLVRPARPLRLAA